ncbi:hypothetical protein GOQ04_12495 [Emticicia sp. ODNR4P]|nr:hypothetical protein [Emticicia sp. ODNR4P]
MFDSHYPFDYRFNQKNEGDSSITTHHLHFRCGLGNKYVVVVDEYPEGFFVIQFYLWKYKKRKDKYLLTAKTESANVKVISTCFFILLDFLEKNPNASFAFQGIYDSTESRKPTCRNKDKSQRFRIYEYMMVNRISENIFNHAVYDQENAYLLVNKRDRREDIVRIIEDRFISELR